MRHPMMSVLEQNPVLPAVKDAGRLEACLAQPAGVVFLLCGDILNIDRLIDRVHQAGKYAVVHADLVAGLAPREIAVDFLHRCGADGIISTRPMLLRRGRELGLLTVWVFVAAAGLLLAGTVVCRLRRQRLPRLGGRTPGFWAACGLGGLFLLIALLAALDFDGAFTVFHSIFFPGKDNWLFDPVTDPVILILPEAFFRNCAIAIVTVLLTVCIMLVVTGRKRPSCRSAPGEGTAS